MAASLEIRRLYSHHRRQSADGFRVFIDRLWPRGVSKNNFEFDVWCKDLAPSPALRKWFGHTVQKWPVFCDRYRVELCGPAQRQRIRDILKQADGKDIILLYGAKDPQHNHAVILAEEFRKLM